MPRKLVLVVVDGMTPAAFERAVEGGRGPALSFLAEHVLGLPRSYKLVIPGRRAAASPE